MSPSASLIGTGLPSGSKPGALGAWLTSMAQPNRTQRQPVEAAISAGLTLSRAQTKAARDQMLSTRSEPTGIHRCVRQARASLGPLTHVTALLATGASLPLTVSRVTALYWRAGLTKRTQHGQLEDAERDLAPLRTHRARHAREARGRARGSAAPRAAARPLDPLLRLVTRSPELCMACRRT